MEFIATTMKTAVGAAAIAAASVFGAASALAAPPTIQGFGTSERLVDGPMVTSYTVGNLQLGDVTIAGYLPQGQLYSADVTARSVTGTITPLVSSFNARAANGDTYGVVNEVPAPGGLNPAPILQGNSQSGVLYFDVTGPPPNGVVYNDGVQDVLIWTSNV
ncbi:MULTISPECIES: MPT63 family protein [Mycobacterium]|uniref:MPT63-like domain-containing protein n=1 Tax=Mycobacterium pseudoshottsii TaxID=265949 RepID=A0A9N7LQR6_9MYCO|nr:hypothetical protein MMSP_4370 [Mycobacterium sp. 012931]BDN81587.1 hypothetical protein NJB1907Z4_C18020 [Mycobacterium pseudoshottsii]BEH75991.1 hypothetical protein YM3MPS_17940 [Mycobacterium pseudoshottsii]